MLRAVNNEEEIKEIALDVRKQIWPSLSSPITYNLKKLFSDGLIVDGIRGVLREDDLDLFELAYLTKISDKEFEIVNIDIIEFPDKIIYIANHDSSIDMSGCILRFTIKNGDKIDERFENDKWCRIEHNVDFNSPGIYEINILRSYGKNTFSYKIPIQVVDIDKLWYEYF